MTVKAILVSTIAAMALVAAGGAQALTDYTLGAAPNSLQNTGAYGIDKTPYRLRPDGAWGNYAAVGVADRTRPPDPAPA